MATAEKKLLGIGYYTPAEAALYSRVPMMTLSRWLYGNNIGNSVLQPERGAKERKVSFLDFVQTLAIRNLRFKYGVPLQAIRRAIEKIENEYDIEYPFARKHTTYLLGKEILIEVENIGLVQMTGRHHDQIMMQPIVEMYLKDLHFGGDGLAHAYTAYKWQNFEITMNPKRRFGEPVLESCGYTAQTIHEAVLAEGSIEAAAVAYGVNVDEVEAAERYFDYLTIRPQRE